MQAILFEFSGSSRIINPSAKTFEAARGGFSTKVSWGWGMRQLMVGAALLISALVVTFATASILQSMAAAKRTIVAEPFAVEKITPAATATRGPRAEPVGARSLVLARRAEL